MMSMGLIKCGHTLSELLQAVVPGDLNLEDRERDDVGGQTAEALSSATTHAHQQHVTPGLTDHPHYAAHYK